MDADLFGAVRDYLQTLQELDFGVQPLPNRRLERADDDVLLVNARLRPTVAAGDQLRQLAQENRAAVVTDAEDGVVLAAKIQAKNLAGDASTLDNLIQLAESLPNASIKLNVFRWPHDVVCCQMAEMATAMEYRITHGDYRQLQDGVFVGENVHIGQNTSIDTSSGAILLEDNVRVGPFCYLEGPLHAGAGTRVIEHSAIKDGVSLGHTVKIGGEVEASVIEAYTNKQHHGFLGHSYLGSWINLGAGTCNSDLKNTYGKINIEYGEQRIATGMQFLGCIMGDYSKTAINTGIFTGKVIGVCSMLYGFVTSNVPSFVNYARLFGQTSLLPPDVMINSQQRMFARRKVEQRECDRQLMLDMYERTSDERESADQLGL